MPDVVVIFRTHSDIEASIVRGLLETHGIRSLVSSDVPHSVFPLNVDGLGEVRISVREADAEEAQRIILSHRAEIGDERVVRIRDEFEQLEKRLEYRFRDRGLLEHALTHRSRAHEDVTGGVADNESLEFLGDAVLGFVIADLLFREFPQYDEGHKSKIKASLVSAPVLAGLSEQLALGEHLLLGRGEEKTGGRRKQALLADTLEAIIAAIYVDGGVEAAREFILRAFRDLLQDVRENRLLTVLTGDYKSALQEFVQARNLSVPEYRVAAEAGPDHYKRFQVEVWVEGAAVARGEGRSKKEAEQVAARRALQHYGLRV
jgi:ribonuclease-3